MNIRKTRKVIINESTVLVRTAQGISARLEMPYGSEYLKETLAVHRGRIFVRHWARRGYTLRRNHTSPHATTYTERATSGEGELRVQCRNWHVLGKTNSFLVSRVLKFAASFVYAPTLVSPMATHLV